MDMKEKWDFFICHASEDKEAVARPLASALIKIGFGVWFDEVSLTLGDSLSKSIDQGLSNSRYGIVILSPNFFSKQWPQRELNALATMEMVKNEKKILPIWHNVNSDYVSNFSPVLADKIGVPTSSGLDYIIKEVKRAFSVGAEESNDAVVINRFFKPIIDGLVIQLGDYSLKYIEGDKTTVIELQPRNNEALGRIIGKEGKTARALRTLLSATLALNYKKE